MYRLAVISATWSEDPDSGLPQGDGSVLRSSVFAVTLQTRRKRHPLQCSCLENPMDRGAWWAACSPWGRKESGTTE